MSCSCGDPFCDGYNCNNGRDGFAIILFVLLYPYLPFMIFGYEIMNYLGNGVNFIKWLGAIIGLGLGLFFYFKFFKRVVLEFLGIENQILYWFFCYILASFMFVFLEPIFPDNQVLNIVISLWKKFFDWCFLVS